MGFLFLSIISSTFILIAFRYFERLNVNTFNAIIINYFTASVLGFLLAGKNDGMSQSGMESWFHMAVIIGIIFVIMFYVIALTTQKTGLTISSISSRMSVIIPMIFSIVFYKESLPILKATGILLAPTAVVLSIIRKDLSLKDKKFYILPVIMFLGVGITDSLVKYTQHEFLSDGNVLLFSAYLFVIAFSTSILYKLIFQAKKGFDLSGKDLVGGIVLGLFNFSSLYLFIQALGHSGIDSSLVFGINGIGIVLLSVFAGLILFKEKLSTLNWGGIIIAILTLILLFSI